MAHFTVFGIDDLMKQLDNVADSEAIALDMVKEGQQTLYNKMYTVAQVQPYPHSATGVMKKALKKMKVKNKNGSILGYVKFWGYDRVRKTKDGKGVPNSLKAMALEYGGSRQSSRPFVRDSVEAAEVEVLTVMQAEFNKHIQ